ncbi:MAG: methyl-accepting chemotaxis protein [Gammaproteobacteria bacterium]|nr:MAG: methyl-accepting chemotaxis protein [Gammaproteobacteria bacterium]
MFAQWSLRKKISTSVGVSLVLVGCAVAYLSYSSAMKATEVNIAHQVEGISATFTKYVSDWFALKGKSLESFPANSDDSNYNRHLVQLKIAADVDNAFLAFADGKLVNANNLVMAPGNDDPRKWSWYINAMADQKKTFIDNPSVASATGKSVVSLGRAIINSDGSVKGVIGIDVVIDNIVQQLRDISLPGQGYMFIATRKGTVFAHADDKLLNKSVTLVAPELTTSYVDKLLAKKDELHLVKVDGRSKQVFASAIPNSDLILILVLDRLSDIASGGGDLSRRLPVTSSDEVGKLAANFNRFVDHMSDLVMHIRNQATDLQDNARSMADRAYSSVKELGQQQEQISMVAQSMDEMTNATHEISRHAERTATSVDESVSSAEEGKNQVDKTRDSIVVLANKVEQAGSVISNLNKHAQDINGILATIQGIAEQTNLLALNAAIEAARAGEQGRGFAVVADEVRVLSQRTHASTGEIQAMITSLQGTAQHAVAIMDDSRALATGSVSNADNASRSLNNINDAVGVISNMASQIATAAEEQSQVMKEVLRNMTAIKRVADSSAEDAHQGEARAKVLQDHSSALNEKVSTFKL